MARLPLEALSSLPPSFSPEVGPALEGSPALLGSCCHLQIRPVLGTARGGQCTHAGARGASQPLGGGAGRTMRGDRECAGPVITPQPPRERGQVVRRAASLPLNVILSGEVFHPVLASGRLPFRLWNGFQNGPRADRFCWVLPPSDPRSTGPCFHALYFPTAERPAPTLLPHFGDNKRIRIGE